MCMLLYIDITQLGILIGSSSMLNSMSLWIASLAYNLGHSYQKKRRCREWANGAERKERREGGTKLHAAEGAHTHRVCVWFYVCCVCKWDYKECKWQSEGHYLGLIVSHKFCSIWANVFVFLFFSFSFNISARTLSAFDWWMNSFVFIEKRENCGVRAPIDNHRFAVGIFFCCFVLFNVYVGIEKVEVWVTVGVREVLQI